MASQQQIDQYRSQGYFIADGRSGVRYARGTDDSGTRGGGQGAF